MEVGAAMRGLRPVVELMYVDFAPICLDPIVNQAAKMRYMTGGQVHVPMVIRAPGAPDAETPVSIPEPGNPLHPYPGIEGGGARHPL